MTSRALTAALIGLTLICSPPTLHATTAPTSILNFVFTGCGDICPTQTADLVAIQAHLPPDLRDHILFLSISVDPEQDFPAAMRAFAEAHDVDFSNWRFLTGTPDAIHRIDDFFGAIPPNASPGLAGHATTVRLLAPNGQSVMRYVGSPMDARRLAEDITTLSTQLRTARSPEPKPSPAAPSPTPPSRPPFSSPRPSSPADTPPQPNSPSPSITRPTVCCSISSSLPTPPPPACGAASPPGPSSASISRCCPPARFSPTAATAPTAAPGRPQFDMWDPTYGLTASAHVQMPGAQDVDSFCGTGALLSKSQQLLSGGSSHSDNDSAPTPWPAALGRRPRPGDQPQRRNLITALSLYPGRQRLDPGLPPYDRQPQQQQARQRRHAEGRDRRRRRGRPGQP